MTPDEPVLSVCVVSYSTRDILRDCLASVERETRGIPFEVIVVDNASTDGSADMVAEMFPEVRLIRSHENLRYAGGCNRAMRESKGEFVLLLNSDTVVLGNALERMVAFMRERDDVGVLGCRLLRGDDTPGRSYGIFPSIRQTIAFSSRFARRLVCSPLYRSDGVYPREIDVPVAVDFPSGACFMIRRQAMEEVGGLDEGFWFYGEESDYGWRLKKHGWRAMLAPVEVVHLEGASTHMAVDEMLTRCRMAQWHFVRKHASGGYWTMFVGCELAVIAWQVLVMPVKRMLGRISRAHAEQTLATIRRTLAAAWAGEYRQSMRPQRPEKLADAKRI